MRVPQGYRRDKNTGAILSTSIRDLENYKLARSRSNKLNKLEQRLELLEKNAEERIQRLEKLVEAHQ